MTLKIISFTSYGENDADFLIDLIGYTISEYDYQFGVMNVYEDDEFEEWLKDNTYLDELQEVAF